MSSLQYWIRKTHGKPLAQADFQDAPAGAQPCLNRTNSEIELHVLRLRRELALGPLGEIGASAISRALAQQFPDVALPCPRTIHRILERHGLLDGRRRVRRPAPPRGWYLPALASHQVELDCFDGVDGLVIRGGQCLEVFTAISHWGGLPAAWPLPRLTTDAVLLALQEHWRQHGLPAYAQFDNATIFSGAHHFADTFGRVVRLCLQLGVVPVFCPVQETGFQAQIESFNGRWQIAVWQRFAHRSLATVCRRNHAFLRALRCRLQQRLESAPPRRPWPGSRFRFEPSRLPSGRIIYLRRTNEAGQAVVLGRAYEVDPAWQAKLVRAELDLANNTLAFYGLRRRAHDSQPLLRTLTYQPHDSSKPHPPACHDDTAVRLKITAKNR